MTEPKFTTDWTSDNASTWKAALAPLVASGRAARVLEVGTWEGQSALWFLEHLPRSHVTCIDTFEGSSEHQLDSYWRETSLRGLEARWDSNLSTYVASGRVRKIKEKSLTALSGLSGQQLFDVIYVDGSHHAADVFWDSFFSWRLLVAGGVLIWDDYLWPAPRGDTDVPKTGIDTFLRLVEGKFKVLAWGYQVIVQKEERK